MSLTQEDWARVRKTVRRTVSSSLHCTVGSHNADGSIHLTPIGSVILTEFGQGFYFDIFNRQLSQNLERDPRVSILAVDSARLMWLRSLLRAGFTRPPGVRLTGRVGPRRPSTPEEVSRFHRVVWPLLRTPGGALLWRRLPHVRDLQIDSVLPLRVGKMTEARPKGV